jgi:hypothetical protein
MGARSASKTRAVATVVTLLRELVVAETLSRKR